MAGSTRRGAIRGVAVAAVLLAASACGGAATGVEGEPRVIEIEIDGFHFVPDHFTVHQDEVVRFMISNPDTRGHELFIGTIAEQAERREAGPTAPPSAEDVTHFGYGIYIPPMSDGELDYAFSAETDLLIGCHLPGHWEAGMVATIDVQP
jgi:uncharacterized cupredoxin-like copper-binding protein